jgi:hypothetical protein
MSGRWFVVAVVASGAITGAGMVLGAWWLTFPVGVALGVVIRARYAMPAGALAGLLAWGLPLGYEQWRYGIGPAARSLAEIMGITVGGPVAPVALTCVVGLLLGLTGAWVGAAGRSVVFSGQSASSR